MPLESPTAAPDLAVSRVTPEPAAPPYREVLAAADQPIPQHFRELVPTRFRIATRSATPSRSDELLIIFPGFGVSVAQIQVDCLLWQHSRRYSCILTHDAVNYRTSHAFVLWQYGELLRRLPHRRISVLGMSLGGTTAIQLLTQLRAEPELYQRFLRVVTLVAAVSDLDFSPRWQNILRLIGELRGGDRPQGEVQRLLRGTVLRVVARAIQKNVQRSCLEASSCDEIVASFTHFGQAYAPTTRALELGALPGVEVVSLGLELDGMVANAQAHRYAQRGRHILLSGEHTPNFYGRSKDQYDRLLLQELG